MVYSKIFCLTSYPGLCFCKRKIVLYFEHISLNRLFHYFFTCLYSPKGSIKPAKITFSMIFKRFVLQLKTDMNTAIDFAPMLNVRLFMFDLKNLTILNYSSSISKTFQLQILLVPSPLNSRAEDIQSYFLPLFLQHGGQMKRIIYILPQKQAKM